MSDEPDPLWLIPRSVRDKLDRIGVKLHLREWQNLSLSQRQCLCDQACESSDEIAQFAAMVRECLGYEPERLHRTHEV